MYLLGIITLVLSVIGLLIFQNNIFAVTIFGSIAIHVLDVIGDFKRMKTKRRGGNG